MSAPPQYSTNAPGVAGQPPCPPTDGGDAPQPPAGGNYSPPAYPQPHGHPPPAETPMGCCLPQPIMTQPVASGGQGQYGGGAGAGDGRMKIPTQVPSNCPPGLQYLASIDQLFVKQNVELLEALIGFETCNKYTIRNNRGNKIYFAVEETDCCTRNCCGSGRGFDLRIIDDAKNEVIHLQRECRCDLCCFPCCLQELKVFSPPGVLVGSVEQTWSICNPQFDIKNEAGDIVLTVEGPVCQCGVCSDVEFMVLSKDKSAMVGKISKQWCGFARELFTDSDYFGISFPLDLDVRMKAVMLGACFLIDFMFFEESNS